MERRTFLMTAGAATAAAVSGCIGDVASGENAGGSNEPAGTARAITVSADGEVSGDPDLAVIRFAIEARGDTAEEVRAELAADADALVEALQAEGIPDEDISTDRFRIRERIDRRRAERDGVEHEDDLTDEHRYYEGTHRYEVEVDDVERVGEVIDAAVSAGADDVGRVTFTLSDERREELREEALREALRNARSEAEVIAEEVNAEIVEVVLVDTSDGRITPVRREAPVADDAPAGTPTPQQESGTTMEPGDVTVTVSVQAQYEMA